MLAGPRQVGKTVLARQVIEDLAIPSHYASADEPTLRGRTWLEQQWDLARLQTDSNGGKKEALLVLDEVQKIADWSEIVKRLWDEDSAAKRQLKVVLLGSAPLLIQKGLTESLAGRFEIIPATHWSFGEMREAFGWKPISCIAQTSLPTSLRLFGTDSLLSKDAWPIAGCRQYHYIGPLSRTTRRRWNGDWPTKILGRASTATRLQPETPGHEQCLDDGTV